MINGNYNTEGSNPAPPSPAGSKWFSSDVEKPSSGLSTLASSFLEGLPEHYRTQATILLAELDATGSQSISADTELALINSIVESERSRCLHDMLCEIYRRVFDLKVDIVYNEGAVAANTVYLREPGTPGTPEADAMEARIVEAIRMQGFRTKGVTFYKKNEEGKFLVWTGVGAPDSGCGEWILQTFREWS